MKIIRSIFESISLIPNRIIVAFAAGFVLITAISFVLIITVRHSSKIDAIEEVIQEESEPGRAEIIVKVLAKAYPNRIEKIEFRDDDWAMLMDGVWYYFAEGKMLPEELLGKADEYSGSFGIPNYQKDLPPWTEPSPEQTARFRERGNTNNRNNNNRQRIQRQRSYFFQESLWRAGSRSESSQQVKTIEFLKKRVVVHSDIAEILLRVEKRIMTAAEIDLQVESWVNNIGTMAGWNWRSVAGSQSRSYHSYGIAIDILPKSLGGKETYWQWARDRNPEWWNIPYEKRYHPPDKVVKAFEAYGFVWGGKWQNFDTMHFEYRPEVFILGGLDLITFQNSVSQ